MGRFQTGNLFEWCTRRISIRTFLILNIYINDLDDNISSNVLTFVDDTTVFRNVNNDGDKQHIQNDLDKLGKRSENSMLLNFWKCKFLRTGHGNLDLNYAMGDTVLGKNVKKDQ